MQDAEVAIQLFLRCLMKYHSALAADLGTHTQKPTSYLGVNGAILLLKVMPSNPYGANKLQWPIAVNG